MAAGGKGQLGSRGRTAVFTVGSPQDLLCSVGSSAQCSVAARRGGDLGESRHVYVWLSPFAVHLEHYQHCQLPIPL